MKNISTQKIKTLSVDSAEMVHFNNETRYMIKDTKIYPHNAIGRMIIRFFSKDELYGATGFLTDDNVFITAAHNVRDPHYFNKAAEEVKIFFGLDGDANMAKVKPIQLTGKDFIVPESYLAYNVPKPTDFCDIAWIDLKQHVIDKSAQNIKLSWTIGDLPSSCFYKCKIPDAHGSISGDFNICGNFISIMCFKFHHQ